MINNKKPEPRLAYISHSLSYICGAFEGGIRINVEALKLINLIIGIIFTVCYAYQSLYVPVVWLRYKKRERVTPTLHSYAVLICARNEEEVIADLIGSIKNQTYDGGLVKVFVMADNCTDRTAYVAKMAGAVVYERTNKEFIGKGYALSELMAHIKRDYPMGFDGYFVFDADNILSPDYIEKMNVTFSAGHDIVTSYRNSKNFASSWVSAGYAMQFLRESRYLNHARHILGLSSAVSGTGFLFSRRIAEEMGTWNYHLLTEDIEFSVDQIAKGRRIAFCPDAELYDEQPVTFSQSWRQRMRWSKGSLQVFGHYGKKLFSGIMHGSFSCFDMMMSMMPAFFLSILSIMINIVLGVGELFAGGDLISAFSSMFGLFFNVYLILFAAGFITVVTEWRHINADALSKLLYTFTFPVFMFSYIPISAASLFCRTGWKPIRHTLSMARLESTRIAGAAPRRRRAAAFMLAFAFISSTAVVGINAYVMDKGNESIIESHEITDIGEVDCIVVLGCSEEHERMRDVDILRDRLICGVELYRRGVSHKLLMSCFGEGRDVDTEIMKQYTDEAGVAPEDVSYDNESDSVYESLSRAKEIYGAGKILVVAQEYQLTRALYIAQELELEAYGVASDYHIYEGQFIRACGEAIARVKDFGLTVMRSDTVDGLFKPQGGEI